jgi:hypothetical protein
MTMTKLYSLLALAVVVNTVACEGRDPLISQKNEDAVIVPPPPPPPPEVRTLSSKRLFGTLPIENRFEDPLLTFSGSGWFGFSNDFNSYPVMVRQVGASPTQTPFLRIAAEENPAGATVIGQVKTATTPLHVELWVGRDGDGASFDTMDISLAGLFVQGGEGAVALQADDASRVDVNGRTWMKFTADLDSGPVGWSWLLASDTDASNTFYVGGPAAVDLDVTTPGAALRLSSKRAMTASEKRMIAEVQEKTRTLSAKRDVRPAPLPGVPR